MNNSTIALIGANGRAGSAILAHFITKGFKVKALARDPSKIRQPLSGKLQLVSGDVLEPGVLEDLIRDCDVIINAISNRGNPRPISSDITSRILSAIINRQDVRYFVITGKTVKSKFDKFSITTFLQRIALRKAFPGIVASKQEEYSLLDHSTAEWTLIRCPLIVEDTHSDFHVSLTRCSGKQISRANIARYIAEELERKEHLRQSPYVFE